MRATHRRSALAVPAALVLLAAPAQPAAAKEFVKLVLVGSAGDSLTLRPPTAVLDGLFDGRIPAQPRGAYVKIHPLGVGDFPGVPGRFFPEAGAVCLSWDRTRIDRCHRPPASLLREVDRSRALIPFRGASTTLRYLRRGPRPVRHAHQNIHIAVELAFDRSALARRASRPRRCIALVAAWRGPGAHMRPTRLCLSPLGVYARTVLYPVGPAGWSLLRSNP
jgi:hypothetical protein